MLSTLRRLSSRTGHTSEILIADNSIFGYIKKASLELESVTRPRDLESLSRVISSIDSFQYPPFQPTLREMFSKGGDSEWRAKLIEDSKNCKGGNALKYLSSLVCCDVPEDITHSLLQNVRIQSTKDISDFFVVVNQLQGDKRSKSVFAATNLVLQNAIQAKLGLSVYIEIYESILKRNSAVAPIVSNKLVADLCQSGWHAMLRDWKRGETELVDAIRWLCLGQEHPSGIDKAVVSGFITQLETRVRMTEFSPESVFTIVASILRISKPIVPEPLDSIAQLLLSKFPRTLSPSQLVALVDGVNHYSNLRTRPVQLESLVDALLPLVVSETRRCISSIPAQHLPRCLELLGRVDPGAVEVELRRRGFEMDPVALVKLILSFPDGRHLLGGLFAADLEDHASVVDFVNRLTLEEQVQMLALQDCAVVNATLVHAISERLKQPHSLSTECLVRMAAFGGDAVFSPTGLVPSKLILERFESAPQSFSNEQAILLLQNCRWLPMREQLVAHVCASHTLSTFEGIQLLRETAQPFVLKRIVPVIEGMSGIELMDLLALLPPMNATAAISVWSPENQLQAAVVDRFGVLASGLTIPQIVTGLVNLGRLGYFELEAMTKILRRLEQGSIAGSSTTAVALAKALAQLGVYSGRLVDVISEEFLAGTKSTELLCEIANAWMHLGVRNDRIIERVEETLRLEEESKMSTRIALLHVLGSQGVFSALFQEELRRVIDEASGENVGQLTDLDWTRLFEINLAIVIEAPPKIKVKYANNASYKAFIDDHCAFAWYAKQEKARSKFIHSTERAQLVEAMTSLGWSGSVPEAGKEVYHIDLLMGGSGNRAIVFVPPSDELKIPSGQVRIIVGESLAKIKHLQIFGYKIVPVWASEWRALKSVEERKECLLANSLQTVYSLGPEN